MTDSRPSWSFDEFGTVDAKLRGLTLREDQLILVRCIDSDRRLAGVQSHLRQYDKSVLQVRAGVLVSARSRGLVATLLHGFDEIWIGCGETDWNVIADALHLTSDGTRFAGPDPFIAPSESIEDYVEPLRRSGATLGMGDGIGLNVICRQLP